MTERKEKINNFLKEINEVCKKHNFGLLNTTTKGIILVDKKEDGTYHIAPPASYIDVEFNEKELNLNIVKDTEKDKFMIYEDSEHLTEVLLEHDQFLHEIINKYNITLNEDEENKRYSLTFDLMDFILNYLDKSEKMVFMLKTKESEKKQFSEIISLTEIEYEGLITKFGEERTKELIDDYTIYLKREGTGKIMSTVNYYNALLDFDKFQKNSFNFLLNKEVKNGK